MIVEQLRELIQQAAAGAGFEDARVELERPKRREHGDWSTNVALSLAGRAGRKPREVAEDLVGRLQSSTLISSIDIAGPGFINFHLSPAWLHEVVRSAATDEGFGRSAGGAGIKVNVEYVSSNPTGPINVVSGRHAAVGDTISNLLEATGHDVVREFYWNDMGRQIELFGESIAARYLQHFERDAQLPEDGYQGDYVTEIAKAIADEVGDRYIETDPDERARIMREAGMKKMLESAQASLGRFGTTFDLWTRESSLHESGAVLARIEELKAEGLVYEDDGAWLFRSSKFGDDKDRVVVRSNGKSTYFASDIAYLHEKFSRAFDKLIYLWGADHHGTVPRLLAAVEALGHDRTDVEIPIVQMVTLSRGGETVKASKRAGVIVMLDELLDEIGVDAARYTFLTRSIDASLDFDIELAKEQAPENPVYYVQYAHARICSIIRRAGDEGHSVDPTQAPLERLEHPSEDALMRKLSSFEETLTAAAAARAPQRITRFVEELASDFSSFYRDCKVVTDDEGLTSARLALCLAAQAVIAKALSMLGVSAPERM